MIYIKTVLKSQFHLLVKAKINASHRENGRNVYRRNMQNTVASRSFLLQPKDRACRATGCYSVKLTL